MFTNHNLTCVHCGQPVDFEEQVFCTDCDYEFYDPVEDSEPEEDT